MKPKIAVVEDNLDNRLLVQAILEDGYEISEYENGMEVLDGLADDVPELVLLDMACEFNPFNTFYKPAKVRDFVKAGCGKTARPVCAADGGEPLSRRLLRPDSVRHYRVGKAWRANPCRAKEGRKVDTGSQD